jgi:vanillate O-demethylase ferredoxin subunit
MEGVYGTCETPVLEGTPDHRDLVLSKQEKESNRTMMICCSPAAVRASCSTSDL